MNYFSHVGNASEKQVLSLWPNIVVCLSTLSPNRTTLSSCSVLALSAQNRHGERETERRKKNFPQISHLALFLKACWRIPGAYRARLGPSLLLFHVLKSTWVTDRRIFHLLSALHHCEASGPKGARVLLSAADEREVLCSFSKQLLNSEDCLRGSLLSATTENEIPKMSKRCGEVLSCLFLDSVTRGSVFLCFV